MNETHLVEPWLSLARAAWLLLVALTAWAFVVGPPELYLPPPNSRNARRNAPRTLTP